MKNLFLYPVEVGQSDRSSGQIPVATFYVFGSSMVQNTYILVYTNRRRLSSEIIARDDVPPCVTSFLLITLDWFLDVQDPNA
jgi:hypothetical protein